MQQRRRICPVPFARAGIGLSLSLLPRPHPHHLQRRLQLRPAEPDGPPYLEVGDESGHAPGVELAGGDVEVGRDLLFGEQRIGLFFGARRGRFRVHATGFLSTRGVP